jgi:hypothetical protein
MGTRADFYIGKGKDAEWIGSIAWDGYRDGIPDPILNAKRPGVFRQRVTAWLKTRDDATFPADGWPWPWNNSGTSDCSYWFFGGHCHDVWEKYSDTGPRFVPCDEPEPRWGHRGADEDRQMARWLKGRVAVEFPDMSEKKRVTMGPRSGLLMIAAAS